MTILGLNTSDIPMITAKNVGYGCIMYNKSEAIHLLQSYYCLKFKSIEDIFLTFFLHHI